VTRILPPMLIAASMVGLAVWWVPTLEPWMAYLAGIALTWLLGIAVWIASPTAADEQ
jgi:hypothetical protein